ncbi:MAG: hypothetical protein WCI64_02050 [Chlorobium sp.]
MADVDYDKTEEGALPCALFCFAARITFVPAAPVAMDTFFSVIDNE